MASVETTLPHARATTAHTSKNTNDLVHIRLVFGSILILAALIALIGTDWDIQWHTVIGRDRTFTPPHDLILIGIGLTGIVALANILLETGWLRRNPALQGFSTDFLGILHSSLGSYLIGFGAVCSAVAFPLDTYWHSLYGVDVSLWAPFHTMIYMGSVLSTFGMLYLFLSTAHLSETQRGRWPVRLAYMGAIVSLAVLLSKFCTFLIPAVTGHTLHGISIFPILLALCVVFVCALTVRTIPWVGAASLVVLVFLLLWLLISIFIPPLMTQLVHAEHATYLAKASRIGSIVVPLLGQTPALLLPALGIDGVLWLARHSEWRPTRRATWELVAAIIGMILVSAITLVLIRAGIHIGSGGTSTLVLGLALALLLTIPGSLLGDWLAFKLGEVLNALRR